MNEIFIQFIKKIIGNSLQSTSYNRFNNNQVLQKNLFFQYRNSFEQNLSKPTFGEVGFRVYSQFEEDGILLFIFAMIGMKNKIAIEICCGNALECNTTNLLVNHKWWGLLFDGNQDNIKQAEQFFSHCPDTNIWKPKLVCSWITRENINDLIKDSGFSGEIDLLSLDIDGIDYWLWESINIINPRVVLLEFNHLWGPEASVSVPYKSDFVAEFSEYGSDYAGASLSAFIKLGWRKGYRLVGTNAFATNAFFVRNDIEHPWLQEINPKDCFDHPRAKFGMKVRWEKIKDKNWIEV
jgi:hypothetical protein